MEFAKAGKLSGGEIDLVALDRAVDCPVHFRFGDFEERGHIADAALDLRIALGAQDAVCEILDASRFFVDRMLHTENGPSDLQQSEIKTGSIAIEQAALGEIVEFFNSFPQGDRVFPVFFVVTVDLSGDAKSYSTTEVGEWIVEYIKKK